MPCFLGKIELDFGEFCFMCQEQEEHTCYTYSFKPKSPNTTLSFAKNFAALTRNKYMDVSKHAEQLRKLVELKNEIFK